MDFAEGYIDRMTLKGWLLDPITNERYDVPQPTIYLKHRPIVSVQQIKWRTSQVGDVLQTLVSGTHYELFDKQRGEINFMAGYQGRHAFVFVDYTPVKFVPADISHAATLIVAESLKLNIFPDRWGVTAARADADTSITYTDDGVSVVIPRLATEIIEDYRLRLIA